MAKSLPDNLYQAATILLLVIFVILYTSSEMSSGFFKNIGGSVRNVRNLRIFSIWVSILSGCAVILLSGCVTVFGYVLQQFGEVGIGTFGIPATQLINYIVT